MLRRHGGWKQAVSLAGGLVVLALAVALGMAAAAVGFLGSAAFSSHIPLACVAGLLSCVCVAAALGWLAGKVMAPARRRSIALGAGGATGALVVLASALTVFEPLVPAAEITPPDVPPEVRFWDLPTGSRIAHREFRGDPGSGKAPVIYLHGGPGAGVVSVDALAAAFSFLARIGHDVYLYDQVGGGLSGRLANIEEYGLERHLADLEAIRRRIGARAVVLVAESWGAELGSHYLAAHPERVERLVLVSPGPLYPGDSGETDPCDLRGRASEEKQEHFKRLLGPRLLAALLLLEVNPRAAHAFLPDAEADAFARRAFAPLVDGMVCDPASLPADIDFGFGMWGNVMTDEDSENREMRIDAQLATSPTPVLILRGECDYCVPEVARQYEELLPGSRLVELPGAGHLIWLDRPAAFAEVIQAFLLDEPLTVVTQAIPADPPE